MNVIFLLQVPDIMNKILHSFSIFSFFYTVLLIIIILQGKMVMCKTKKVLKYKKECLCVSVRRESYMSILSNIFHNLSCLSTFSILLCLLVAMIDDDEIFSYF